MIRAPRRTPLLALLLVLMVPLVTIASASAYARGGRGHSGGHHVSGAHNGGKHFGGAHAGFGFIVAAPPFWYYPPLPYDPAVAPSAPLLYIEEGGAPSAPDLPAEYWYYCADADTYYPYVKECAGTWQPVAPQAPQSE
jgi:hypothetical protein